MNSDAAWDRLVAGNQRFVAGEVTHPRRDEVRRAEQANVQTPFAVILGCADSRVPHEIVFDEGLGDLFSVRVAGNTANDEIVLGSIEYGAAVLGCSVVVVLGHESCGAVTAAVEQVTKGDGVPGSIGAVLGPIVPAGDAVRFREEGDLVQAVIRENIRRQVEFLQTSDAVLAGLIAEGRLKVVGAEYGLRTGAVERIV